MQGEHSYVIAERSRRRERGFTLIEILIAIVILVLGISGIITLFPTAIRSGNQTVEDSYAAAFTQSVVDAVSVGLREARYRVQDNNGRWWTYFIIDHDGVYDKMVVSPQAYMPTNGGGDPAEQDWCILLPQGPDPNYQSQNEPTFFYPVVTKNPVDGIDPPSGGANQGGILPPPYDARELNNLANVNAGNSDDWQLRPAADGTMVPWVRRVYMLGRYRYGMQPASFPPRWYRQEFLGLPSTPGQTGGGIGTDQPVIDPYPQYSFALAITRARVDTAGAGGPNTPPDGMIGQFDNYSSSLYQLRVMIFRNFDGSSATQAAIAHGAGIPQSNRAIQDFVTLLSL
jgi:prepilin-type N-terminal cleavage/methylation domain-containing protein